MSVLSERRSVEPYGLCGGGPGARGLNLLTRAAGMPITCTYVRLSPPFGHRVSCSRIDGVVLNIGSKRSVKVFAGWRVFDSSA